MNVPQSIGEFTRERRTLKTCRSTPGAGKDAPLTWLDKEGEVLRFAIAPEVPVFVFKTDSNQPGKSYWRVHDPKSGASLGEGGRTRKEAIGAIFGRLKIMLQKHGTGAELAAQIERLRAGWNNGTPANAGF